jgi:hypothetical protein
MPRQACGRWKTNTKGMGQVIEVGSRNGEVGKKKSETGRRRRKTNAKGMGSSNKRIARVFSTTIPASTHRASNLFRKVIKNCDATWDLKSELQSLHKLEVGFGHLWSSNRPSSYTEKARLILSGAPFLTVETPHPDRPGIRLRWQRSDRGGRTREPGRLPIYMRCHRPLKFL